MYIHMERFGQTYTFGVEEGLVPIEEEKDEQGIPVESSTIPKFKEEPEICLLEAVDAVNNLLRCVFPELEGYHLEVVSNNPESDPHPGEGGIDLGRKT